MTERQSGTSAPTDYLAFDLEDWFEHIQRQHWRTIELKLDRISAVWEKLGGRKTPLAITVAGTNGKGSCVAMLEVVLRRAGLRTGAYTSPHLVHYNERVAIDGEPVSDQLLVDAFRQIEQARDAIPLTYFEYGTLCALLIFDQQGVEASILETGMGGRLDAVNIIENDIALVTSIGLDHVQWLGSDRESIGREKAGVFKSSGLAVCADGDPPESIKAVASARGTTLLQAVADYSVRRTNDNEASFHSDHPGIAPAWRALEGLVPPFAGDHQLQNLGCVVAALGCIASFRTLAPSCLDALSNARISGRCEILGEAPLVIADVAHNADSARYLAETLAARPVSGIRYGVFGALEDKDLAPIVGAVAGEIDIWLLATLSGERGQSSEALEQKLTGILPNAATRRYDSAAIAYREARNLATPEDRIVAFGSFFVVGDIIAAVKEAFIDSP